MRRALATILLGAALIVTAALSGCPAAHDDYPGTACTSTSDCYQGEICSGMICVINQDMSIQGDFAHLPFGDGGVADDLTPPPDDLTPVDL
ncbi:MAG: hypothetical protein JWM53_5837 [bacterium]|nr:hypothetical protein [bacterium]